MHCDNSNFFYTVDIDEEGRLKNVLWVDARSRVAFKEFGDIVTFDTTYLTKRKWGKICPLLHLSDYGVVESGEMVDANNEPVLKVKSLTSGELMARAVKENIGGL
ncbi:hypothetical protein LWI29_019404 [Acer saccharum]|uniref:Protein FAR1-RELATED SEQUENCE n=1 Tax=Acer saccharum TaxID=4024 RepID=A0AA39VVG2_ACESA|nr:hypothetical protein LWI29_019404 [Acer saccharum]